MRLLTAPAHQPVHSPSVMVLVTHPATAFRSVRSPTKTAWLSRVSNSADRISAPPKRFRSGGTVCACALRCSYPPDPPGLERENIRRHGGLRLQRVMCATRCWACVTAHRNPACEAWMCRPAHVSGSVAGLSPCHGLPLHAGRACADQHQCRCRFSRHRAAPTTQSRAASR